MCRIFLVLCIALATVLPMKAAQSAKPAASPHSRHFETPYLSLQILPSWTVAAPRPHVGNCCTLTVTHGRYILAVDPLFDHAGPVAGGRFSEIIGGQPSVQAVMGEVDAPAGGYECSLTPMPETRVNRSITLYNLYTDPAKANVNRYGCHFPEKPLPVWFASFFGGEGPESDYNITLTYDSTDINALPRKDSSELAHVLDQVVRMLQTLVLKPPVVITKVVPTSAPSGATVTVYGHGFALAGQRASAIFKELPNSARLVTRVAPDGRSLTFVVPASITTIACPPGKIDVNENCVITPPGHVDVNDCPPGRGQSCSVPIPAATYHISVLEEGMSIWSNAVPFTLTASPLPPVSLLLLHPAYYVQPGDLVTLRGNGFTSTDNTVHIGSVLVQGLSSADGSIRFAIPYTSSLPFQTFPIFVSNTNGMSNVLTLAFR